MLSKATATLPLPDAAQGAKPNLSRSRPRWRGMTTVTFTPSLSRARGRAPMTSPKPPTLANGTHSAAAITTFTTSPVNQLFCSMSCAHNRLDQGHAQTSVFQFQDSVDRTTRRRRNDVLELCRMFSSFQNHARCAEHHLRRQLRRSFPWQTDFDASFNERFNNDVYEGRAARAQACHGVHV